MFTKLNEKIKKITMMDVFLTKLSVFFATITIVKLLPQLLNIKYPVLVLLMFACALKPLYTVWIKK